ncbi:MAG: PAS domain-containing protein [Lachnospiraceae bacterium]|nr:PAS domain-containing protein [Lachnospiraceae bacterium]
MENNEENMIFEKTNGVNHVDSLDNIEKYYREKYKKLHISGELPDDLDISIDNVNDNVIYKKIVEDINDGIVIIGFDGTIRFENPVAAEVLGRDGESMIGKTMYYYMKDSSENDDFFQCIIDAVFERKRIVKTIIYHREKDVRFLRLLVSPIRDKGQDVAVIVVFSDITDIAELGNRNEFLNKKLIEFVNNFVTVTIDTIDARSPYNANHTRNMVNYATKYFDWMDEKGKGLSPEIKNPLLASFWLHDVGKLLIPTEVLDKESRLGDKEKDIFHRIEIAKLSAKVKTYEAIMNPASEADSDALKNELDENIKYLDDAWEFVKKTNVAGFIDDETFRKIEELKKHKCLTSSGEEINLITEDEADALSIKKGTLTKEEREIVQSHVIETFNILTKMNFEGAFENVPRWAGNHHEYLDGSGYPGKLTAKDIPWETRILTIIDIYDALTADDRPYKPAMPSEKAFMVLRSMADEGKLDREILEEFIESKAWEK